MAPLHIGLAHPGVGIGAHRGPQIKSSGNPAARIMVGSSDWELPRSGLVQCFLSSERRNDRPSQHESLGDPRHDAPDPIGKRGCADGDVLPAWHEVGRRVESAANHDQILTDGCARLHGRRYTCTATDSASNPGPRLLIEPGTTMLGPRCVLARVRSVCISQCSRGATFFVVILSSQPSCGFRL
jgi:hypothetical protein